MEMRMEEVSMMRYSAGDVVEFHGSTGTVVSADWDEYYNRPVYSVRIGDHIFSKLSDVCLQGV